MAGSQRGKAIPTQLSLAHLKAFILPHLPQGSRGLAPKLSLHKNLQLYFATTLHGVSVEGAADRKNSEGRPEIHHTRIYSAFRR
jgi:hypothetical protein